MFKFVGVQNCVAVKNTTKELQRNMRESQVS